MTRLELNDTVREQAILLRKNHKLKLPDAVIVATAMTQESVLISNDERLHRIDGLQTMRLALLQ
ncbi:MAG: PIN domain-containing protein [Gammaproteobacteria bacterium]|nr:PIN domain-containing protein [Gammaproteobacteria bacterium]